MRKLLILIFCFGLFNFGCLNGSMINQARANGDDTLMKDGSLNGSLITTLCNVLKFVTGSVGKTLATFAIIFIGVTFLNGKCSWTVLVTFTLGLAAIFGAPAVIKAFTGGEIACKSNNG